MIGQRLYERKTVHRDVKPKYLAHSASTVFVGSFFVLDFKYITVN